MNSEITYFIFDSLKSCEDILSEISQKKRFKSSWCIPHKHPIDDKWLIIYDPAQIADCKILFAQHEEINFDEANNRGWNFGPFGGTFAREREKLEEIQLLFDELELCYGRPNFPLTRLLVIGILSACYALTQNVDKKIKKFPTSNRISQWWKGKYTELTKRSELINSFHIYMNSDKHSSSKSAIKLIPLSKLQSLVITHKHPDADPDTLVINAEGAFMTAYIGTPKERRFHVGHHRAIYGVAVMNAPKFHLGKNIEGFSLLQMMDLIVKYHMDLLFEAEVYVGERRPEQNFIISYTPSQAHLKATNKKL